MSILCRSRSPLPSTSTGDPLGSSNRGRSARVPPTSPPAGQGCHKAASCTILYNLVRILYNSCTTLVQLLYNFVHCDLHESIQVYHVTRAADLYMRGERRTQRPPNQHPGRHDAFTSHTLTVIANLTREYSSCARLDVTSTPAIQDESNLAIWVCSRVHRIPTNHATRQSLVVWVVGIMLLA